MSYDRRHDHDQWSHDIPSRISYDDRDDDYVDRGPDRGRDRNNKGYRDRELIPKDTNYSLTYRCYSSS